MTTPLTAERLRELLSYDPESGLFTRRLGRAANAPADIVAGHADSRGYVKFMVDGRRYFAHRLAWFYVHGRWPVAMIDHRNGVRSDNWIKNLREATTGQNQQNRKMNKDNKSNRPGVSWSRSDRKWRAEIKIGGETRFLGNFDCPDAAGDAYIEAKAKLHTFQPTLREAAQ